MSCREDGDCVLPEPYRASRVQSKEIPLSLSDIMYCRVLEEDSTGSASMVRSKDVLTVPKSKEHLQFVTRALKGVKRGSRRRVDYDNLIESRGRASRSCKEDALRWSGGYGEMIWKKNTRDILQNDLVESVGPRSDPKL
jgi:hypothetical protein